MDGEAGWWTTCGNIGLPPLARVMGVGRQQQQQVTLKVSTCDLRAKILVACKVTPAKWLNLSDSKNILIIHFGLLLKERTLDSIGHDLWIKI